MSKKQSYYIALTAEPRAAINIKVNSLVEKKKSKTLIRGLINKCQLSLENSSTPQEFFEELRANMEKFSEFTDFFDTTAASMATAITQMRFHTMLVDGWDEQYAKILCTQAGKEGISYDLPPPSMVFHLESKRIAKKGVTRGVDDYNRVGTVEFSYGFIDADSVKLEKLSENIPKEAILEAVNTMMKDIEKLHRKAIDKVLNDCGLEPKSSTKSINDDFVGTFQRLGTVEGDSFKPSEKMHELIDRMNIKASDDFDDILNKLMSNPETRDMILEDFKRWRAHKDGDTGFSEDDYRGLMPKPGEFVAEA